MRALGMRLRAKAITACSSSTSLMPNVIGARSLPGMPRYEYRITLNPFRHSATAIPIAPWR